jgi:hypothetical protein
MWRGAREVLLDPSERATRSRGQAGQTEGIPLEEEEDFWEVKPQTEGEKQLVLRQKQKAEEAETAEKDE